jgi:hypothetical protein
MSNFIITPPNPDLINLLVRDPITGLWTMPAITFNIKTINPYYGEIDPLNEDSRYQKRVIDHFYMRLVEKWLYKDPVFRKLLKYFTVEKNGDEIKVNLIPSLDKMSTTAVDKTTRKFIFRYIEKIFITKKFVDKILRQYVSSSRTKWYDLFNNTDMLKELFAHKLKKLIISTIYELQDRKEIAKKKDTASRVKKNNFEDDSSDEYSMWND